MLIPKPKAYRENGTQKIKAQICAEDCLSFSIKAFNRIVKKVYGTRLTEGQEGIQIRHDAALAPTEYKISGAVVTASSTEGAAYGLSTLLQLLDRDGDGFILKNIEVQEKPDRNFRGFMADLARCWHDFERLLSYVDLCYVNKIKYLQLHFTDDQSWTLPFDCFPNAATEGRSYTKEEIAYLVEYAHEAGVELIPEFEGIGHSQHLIEKYPDLFGNLFDRPGAPDGIHNIMCIGRPDIFDNIKKFLAEIAVTFKYSNYIHIGCDEANHADWERCSLCRAYMQKNGLETTKAAYSHFVKKLIDLCLDLGKTPIVWEGFPKEGSEEISRKAIVVAWESYYQTAPELLESGFQIINASWTPLYIVPLQHFSDADWTVTGKDWNLFKWQNWAKFSKAYTPFSIEPTQNVLGGMLCQWECSPEIERDRLILNLPMLSDRTWNESDFYAEDAFFAANEKLISIEEKLI